jgi:hypothetical protein
MKKIYGVCDGETVGDGDIIGVGVGSDGFGGVAVGDGVGVGSEGFVCVGSTVGVGFSVSIGVGGIAVGLTVGEVVGLSIGDIFGEFIIVGLAEGETVGEGFTLESFREETAAKIPDSKNKPAAILKTTFLYIKKASLFSNFSIEHKGFVTIYIKFRIHASLTQALCRKRLNRFIYSDTSVYKKMARIESRHNSNRRCKTL